MQDEAPFGTDRAAEQYGGFRGSRIWVRDFELLKKTTELEGQRPVDHDAQRAVIVMFTDQGNGRAEIRVCHARHSNKQLIRIKTVTSHSHSIRSVAGSHNRSRSTV